MYLKKVGMKPMKVSLAAQVINRASTEGLKTLTTAGEEHRFALG
jgi:hypothetical protein